MPALDLGLKVRRPLISFEVELPPPPPPNRPVSKILPPPLEGCSDREELEVVAKGLAAAEEGWLAPPNPPNPLVLGVVLKEGCEEPPPNPDENDGAPPVPKPDEVEVELPNGAEVDAEG